MKHAQYLSGVLTNFGKRGTSIKTRIETACILAGKGPAKLVKEELPLKQGLKLILDEVSILMKYVKEELPLKQGLKLIGSRYVIQGSHGKRGTSIKTRIETTDIDINDIDLDE